MVSHYSSAIYGSIEECVSSPGPKPWVWQPGIWSMLCPVKLLFSFSGKQEFNLQQKQVPSHHITLCWLSLVPSAFSADSANVLKDKSGKHSQDPQMDVEGLRKSFRSHCSSGLYFYYVVHPFIFKMYHIKKPQTLLFSKYIELDINSLKNLNCGEKHGILNSFSKHF